MKKVETGLLFHYIKISFRNMRKYKTQTLISVISLSVGFTCFALSMLWIRYEMSFDSFHKNAKQLYVVYVPNSGSPSGYYRNTSIPFASYLKKTFPEITNAASIIASPNYTGRKIIVEGAEYPVLTIMADSSFFQLFGIKILVGSNDFLIPGSNKLAITRAKALQLFGNEIPLGKTVINNWGQEYTICAIVYEMSKPSNYPFDIIIPFSISEISLSGIKIDTQGWSMANANTIIELFPETIIKDFEKKLYEHELLINYESGLYSVINKAVIRQLTKMHYKDPDIEREVKFQYIVIFAISGILVVLCSLFNYLVSFLSNIRIRQKQFTLRMIFGASKCSLLLMLTIEFILILLFAVAFGSMLIQLFHKPFLLMSCIQMDLFTFCYEFFKYVSSLIFIVLLVFLVILLIIRYKSMNFTILQNNKQLFRSVSIVIQLVISIGFAFCTIIILKQLYFLQNSNKLGFSFKNRASVHAKIKNSRELADMLKQMPEITEIVETEGRTRKLINTPTPGSGYLVKSWEEKPANVEHVGLATWYVSPGYISFYDFCLLAGEMLNETDTESIVLINESAVKAFGWNEPVGKHFESDAGMHTVKGVIKNIYNFGPTIQVKPACYTFAFEKRVIRDWPVILIKYREGLWKSLKKKIELLNEKEYSNNLTIINSEDEYNEFLKSENALIKLMFFISTVCLLVCVFGFVSIVSLTCEERRKEIAIRKINGATTGNILAIFAKEYFILLIIGAVFAFSAGYFIMQRWLEHYVKQTAIPVWIYLSIFSAMAFIIILCVGWQVYKASVENPAVVLKSE